MTKIQCTGKYHVLAKIALLTCYILPLAGNYQYILATTSKLCTKCAILHYSDIRPNNILLQCTEADFDLRFINTSLLTLKLCDFGVSRSFEGMERDMDDVTVAGTRAFFPPEFLDAWANNSRTIPESKFAWNIDTWATGMVAYMMRMGHLPGKLKTTMHLHNDQK